MKISNYTNVKERILEADLHYNIVKYFFINIIIYHIYLERRIYQM